jgi:hypothetical protein
MGWIVETAIDITSFVHRMPINYEFHVTKEVNKCVTIHFAVLNIF